MISKKLLLIIIGTLVVVFIFGLTAVKANVLDDIQTRILLFTTCGTGNLSDDKQIDCVYQVIERKMEAHVDINDSMNTGIKVFKAAYDVIEPLRSDCHYNAHRLGDFVYYKANLNNVDDIFDINFPQETTACDYGFLHAFIEHWIQSNPDPQFVTEVCGALKKHLGYRMSDISGVCYHAGGHGFFITQLEQNFEYDQNEEYVLLDKLITKCQGLLLATPSEIERCTGGVFMGAGSIGALPPCNILKQELQRICYRYGSVFVNVATDNNNPVDSLLTAINSLQDENSKHFLFKWGISDITDIVDERYSYKNMLGMCQSLEQSRYETCLWGIIHGVFMVGPPQKEYENTLEICTEKTVIQRGERNFCYQKVAEFLPELYSPEKITMICTKFPTDVRGKCEKL